MCYKCKICANSLGNKNFIVREMQFGTQKNFIYFQCSSCGCLQITEPPKDMSKYYPRDGYYSFRQPRNNKTYLQRTKNLIKYLLVNIYLLPFGTFFFKKFPYINTIENSGKHKMCLKILRNLKKTSSILDVGCGVGILLQEMNMWGFKNLTGIDPFIEKDIFYSSGLKIFKQDAFTHIGNYDFIMLHHSFEHMDNPRLILEQLYKMLNPNGVLLIRIPVSDSFAFRKYGSNWFQIDAPRHFYLHTTRSMVLLSKNAGFILKEIVYDSTKEQFIESENYCRDISWLEYKDFSPTHYFNSHYIKKCRKYARYLNNLLDGDQAAFVFQKPIG